MDNTEKKVEINEKISKYFRECDRFRTYEELRELRNRLNQKMLMIELDLALQFDLYDNNGKELLNQCILELHNWNNPVIRSKIHNP